MLVQGTGTPTMEISASWSVLISFAALGFTLYQTVIRRDEKRDEITKEIVAMKQRVDVIWNLIFPGSVAAALRGGILERHSPLTWSTEAVKKYEPLLEKIREWYDHEGFKLRDLELLVQVSTRFGPDVTAALIAEPEPKGFGYEAIILALTYMCRPNSELFSNYNTGEWQEKTTNGS